MPLHPFAAVVANDDGLDDTVRALIEIGDSELRDALTAWNILRAGRRARMASQAFRLREMFMQLRLTCEALQSLGEEGAR